VQVPAATHEEPPPEDGEELEWEEVEEEAYPAETADQSGVRRFLPSLRFLSGMAALGIVLALGWRYSGAEEWAIGALRPAAASQAATATSAPAPEGDLARTTREIDALKKTVGELAAANQQMAAKIAALQASQQELLQRPSGPPLTSWSSGPATMKYRIVTDHRTTGSITPRAPTARAEPRSTPKPSENAPLQLTAPRP
jgi:hypothetical protein